ncbi:MAG: PAS domain-containing protein [Oscillochloris sp.]|nr:PAS domain-containing protein [Oscillochloris sp.]
MTDVLTGGGELGRLVHTYNWAQSDLGAREHWPQSLKLALQMMLAAAQPIWIGWGEQLIHLYNDECAALLGDRHPALGQPAARVWHDHWHVLEPLVQAALLHGAGTTLEAQVLPTTRNGAREDRSYTVSCIPLPDERAPVGGVMCIYTDETERIRSSFLAEIDHPIQQRDIRLDLAGRAMRMVTWEWDVRRDQITTSSTFAEIYGLPALATVADGFSLVFPEDKPAHAAKVQAIAADGGEYLSEFRIQRPDNGQVVWLEERATAFRDTQGRVERVIGQTFDVTARKLIEMQLRTTQARLEAALKAGLAGTFFWDMQRDRLITDENMRRYFSLPVAALSVGVPLAAVLPAIHEDDRARVNKALNEAAAEGAVYEGEYRVYHSDGSLRWLSVRGSIEPDGDAERRAMSGFAVDVTARKQAEEQLRLSEARQSFLLMLSDALRPLADPQLIQATASRVLGAYLQVTRAFYAEAESDNTHMVIHQDYHNGVPSAAGRYRMDDFGAALAEALRAGRTVVVDDVTLVDSLSAEERAAYAAIDVRAHLTVCLVKESRLVALLGIRQSAPRHWTDAELLLVEETAERTWAAVERSRAQAASQASEERYRSLLESVDQGFCVFEMIYDAAGNPIDYRFLEVNAMFERHTGLQHALGKTARELVPNLEADWFKIYGRVAKTGEPANFEQGSVAMGRWFSVEAVRVGGAESRKVALLFTDITARKQSERDADFLSELSEQIRLSDRIPVLLEQSVQMLGRYIRVQRCMIAEIDERLDRWQVVHGYNMGAKPLPAATRLSDYPSSLVHTLRNGQMVIARQTDPPADHLPVAYVALPFLRDGRWVAALVLSHNRPRQWENREIVLLETVGERIWSAVERLRFEALQQEESTRLQQLNAASLAINAAPSREVLLQQITNAAQTLIGTHLALVRLMLDAADQASQSVTAQAKGISQRQVDYARAVAEAIAQVVCEQRRPLRLTPAALGSYQVDPAFNGDATYLPSELLVVPLLAGDGTCIGLIQVSDKRAGSFTAADEALLQQLAQLAAIALEKQLLFEQELAARAQAEEANRLKDEFLATVSHELRTPLTALLGYAQLMQWRKRDEAYIARTLTKIVSSAKAQAQIIEDLLDISRIVSGKLRLDPNPIDLGDVIHNALDTVRPAVEAKSIRLQIELDGQAMMIVGDANRLQQVVWNLLSNATKFTPSGGIITVRLERDDHYARLSISDTGQGIAPEFLPFVFEQFRQAESSSNRVHGGLGLGLALVRHLVELHGGTVAAASAGANQGAIFTVRLPLAPLAVATTPAGDERAAATVDPHNIPELSGLRVLVVDDQPDILEILADILSTCGAEVELCTTAHGALATLKSWRPDVLVSDIAMPGEDGYWLIRAVRALDPEAGGNIPAIALTAFVRMEDRMRVLAAGFQLYVPKPLDPAALRDAVAHLAQSADPQ